MSSVPKEEGENTESFGQRGVWLQAPAKICSESEGANVGGQMKLQLQGLPALSPMSFTPQCPNTFLLEPGSSKNVVSAEV